MEDILTQSALWIHYGTKPLVFWTTCVIILSLLVRKHLFREAILIGISLLLTTSIVQVIKEWAEVPRADDALVSLSSYAFPSGHAMASTFLLTTITWLIIQNPSLAPRKYFVIGGLAVMVVVISASRIVIGVHTPLQVFGGMVIGSVVPLTCILIAHRKTTHHNTR